MAESTMELDALGALIEPPDTRAEDQLRTRLPPGRLDDLGRLGELALWWAAVRDDDRAPRPARPELVGAHPDLDPEPTRAWNLLALDAPEEIPAALRWGASLADAAADRGADLMLLSVDDPIATRLLAGELLGLDPVEAAGWPSSRDLDDDAWMAEVVRLRDGMRRTRGTRERAADLLQAVASPGLAAATALLLQAALRRTAVLLDGPGAAAAALVAQRCGSEALTWWQASHLTEEPLHARLLSVLGLEPITRLGLRREDGTAALAGLAVLDLAVTVTLS